MSRYSLNVALSFLVLLLNDSSPSRAIYILALFFLPLCFVTLLLYFNKTLKSPKLMPCTKGRFEDVKILSKLSTLCSKVE